MTLKTMHNYRPSQALTYLIITVSTGFVYWYLDFIFSYYQFDLMTWFQKTIFLFKLPIEIASPIHCIAFLLVGVTFLFIREKPTIKTQLHYHPPVGLIYLCYNDLDIDALRSLMSLSYDGKIFLVIHDDSIDPATNMQTDRVADYLSTLNDKIDIRVLRRKNKKEGKQER